MTCSAVGVDDRHDARAIDLVDDVELRAALEPATAQHARLRAIERVVRAMHRIAVAADRPRGADERFSPVPRLVFASLGLAALAFGLDRCRRSRSLGLELGGPFAHRFAPAIRDLDDARHQLAHRERDAELVAPAPLPSA